MTTPASSGFRLSPQQKRLWEQTPRPEQTPYRAQAVLRIEGPLDRAALERALAAIVAAHEILRTTFQCIPGTRLPVQVISEEPLLALREARIDGGPGAVLDSAAQEWDRAIDPERGPLFGALLLAGAQDQHWLIITLPALCADAAGLFNLAAELPAAYRAASPAGSAGGPPPEATLQYADIAAWQNDLLESPDTAEERRFWQRPMGSPPRLPFERQAADGEPALRSLDLALPAELTAQARALAAALDLPPERVLLSAWCAVLARLSGQPALRIGLAGANRSYEDLPGAIGVFEKILPLNCDLEGQASFAAAARAIGQAAGAALEAQEYYDNLSGEQTDLPYAFSWHEWPDPIAQDGLTWSMEAFAARLRQPTCELTGISRGDALELRWTYDRRSLDESDIRRLHGHLTTALRHAAAAPEGRLAAIALVGAEEQRRLLRDFNPPLPAGERDNAPIHILFEHQAASHPQHPAVCYDGKIVTYGELNDRANRLARHLIGRGLAGEAPVGVYLERTPEALVACLGILKAGAAYAPLDPAAPPARLEAMLAQLALVITQSQLAPSLPAAAPPVIRLDADLPADGASDNPAIAIRPAQLAYLMFTSGSTGRPKGVTVEHRQLAAYVAAVVARLGLTAGNYALVSTFAADLGHTVIFPALTLGGTLHIISQERAMDPDAFAAAMRRWRIDYLKIVPSHLAALLAASDPAAVLPERGVILGGEAASWELAAQIRALKPACALINHYGPTETTVGVAAWPEVATLPLATGSVPLGRPLDHARIYILDGAGQPAAVGEIGEIHIAGAGVARGYAGLPALTAERFIPDPFSGPAGVGPAGAPPGERMYRTGDRGRYLPDGLIEFLGRADFQIKLHGLRIEPGEIEAALLEAPAVRQAIVMARPDQQGLPHIIAYLVASQGQAIDEQALRAGLRRRLPEPFIPSALVILDRLPLTANGKVDRAALAEAELPLQRGAYAAPETDAERTLAEIWAQVLKIDQVGANDNFFALGGDSILSIRVIARAGQAGLHLTPLQFFENPVLRKLAAVATPTAAAEEQEAVEGPIPLTPIQRWFLERPVAAADQWNMVVFEARAPLDPERLERALAGLLAHHDSLRITYANQDDGLRQINAPPSGDSGSAPLAVIELGADEAGWAAALSEARDAVEAMPEGLAGPLVQAALFNRAGAPQRLLIAIHALVADAVSWRIIQEDFQRLYHDPAAALPPKTSSFQRWARRLETYAAGGAIDAAYWQAPQRSRVVPLPRDGGASGQSAAALIERLDAALTDGVLRAAPQLLAQANEVLLSALAASVADWTGETTTLIDIAGHGRTPPFEDIDISRTVGWFVARYPLLLDIGGAGGAAERLRLVKEQIRGVPNQGLDYGVLRYLGANQEVAGRLRAQPEAEISFNYLGQFDEQVPDAILTHHLIDERTQATSSPQRYLIELTAAVAEGRLHLTWTYDSGALRAGTIGRLAAGMVAALREILALDQAAPTTMTPSDFPLADLDSQQLDDLSALFNTLQ